MNIMRIHELNKLVAQRIAAGEVIERPASVVRELIDNSIDAKAQNITLKLKNGGLDEIVLIDDGIGINKEDLLICTDSHTTSKVNSLEDLYHLNSMGFRGEALYSISAVSKLTIASSYQGEQAYSIIVDNGKKSKIISSEINKGSRIIVEDLFAEIPARRQFLKRPSTEATMCKNVLIEKALAFNEIEFRYYVDDKLVLHFPKTTKQERIVNSMTSKNKILLKDTLELASKYERYSLYAVAALPYIKRSDRSNIKIYINNRPIQNYALVQAVTYGYGELLPGGSFPYCYLFINIDPTLVDFNIHPSKREAKIRIQSEIHHSIVTMIQKQMDRPIPSLENTYFQSDLPIANDKESSNIPLKFNNYSKPNSFFINKTPTKVSETSIGENAKPKNPDWFSKAKEILSNETTSIINEEEIVETSIWRETKENDFKYIGQAFNLFLIVEKDNQLYLIDQHAAHERILFDQIKERQSVQKLLIPLEFEVDRDVDNYLDSNIDIYMNLGIKIKKIEPMLWQLCSIPTVYKPIEDKIVNYIKNNTGDSMAIEAGIFAVLACHSAIRQGDIVDESTAINIIKKVFELEEPVCPHGRTFLIRFDSEELKKAVGRT
ncbi:MAG: DNA mismatch repair endonuclease MutL [Pleomorphochaeta sp.]